MNVARKLSILYVSYPLLPVSDESAGGAEQMLSLVERAMALRGHRTMTAACAGSVLAGELLATGRAPGGLDQFDEREAEHNRRTIEHAAGHHYDLVHDHSGSFWCKAGALDCPVMATLHLPRSFYRPQLFASLPPNVFLNCVSSAQASSFSDLPQILGVVRNGIDLEHFPFWSEKQGYLLWMGRICEEKAPHLAIEIARRARRPLIIAGQVYPFSYHERYYREQVRPHLGAQVTFIDTPTFAQKVKLLRHAHCLLLTSTCEETSSLIALEAMACGTPVISFRRGALPEIIIDGETGLLVDTPEQMAACVDAVGGIDLRACRAHVERHYSWTRMADDYEQLYRRVLSAAEDELPRAA